MHELSIVQSIVEVATEEMKRHNAAAVERIDLEIGTQAGIEFYSLDFAWDVGVLQTPLQYADKVIHKIQARARCLNCQHVFDVDEPYPTCPVCREVFVDLIQGKELKIKSLTLI